MPFLIDTDADRFRGLIKTGLNRMNVFLAEQAETCIAHSARKTFVLFEHNFPRI